MEGSTSDPNVESNRESATRAFLGEYRTHTQEQTALYDWLLTSSAPNNQVLQNLQAGASAESQVVALVAGNQFFANRNNDNRTFVTNAYGKLLERNPAQWEADSAVADLNGYQIFIEEPCPPPPCTGDGFCMEEEPEGSCGYYEWYQKSRDELAWELVSSHELHQCAAAIMQGIQLRRNPTSTEVESIAYHIGAYGLKEGAVRVLKGQEYFDKSVQPW